ncbi:MAG: hypothetical protein J6Y14_01360 [Fibrobacter sp.]|nr:hypothetical protein [Fibrobacter sp.]
MTASLSVILEAKRRGSSASLYWILRHVVPQNDVVVRHPDAEGGRIQ